MVRDYKFTSEYYFENLKLMVISKINFKKRNGGTFTYYSRNLKTVQPHKTEYLKEYITKGKFTL